MTADCGQSQRRAIVCECGGAAHLGVDCHGAFGFERHAQDLDLVAAHIGPLSYPTHVRALHFQHICHTSVPVKKQQIHHKKSCNVCAQRMLPECSMTRTGIVQECRSKACYLQGRPLCLGNVQEVGCPGDGRKGCASGPSRSEEQAPWEG